jgi:hypothetical protein
MTICRLGTTFNSARPIMCINYSARYKTGDRFDRHKSNICLNDIARPIGALDLISKSSSSQNHRVVMSKHLQAAYGLDPSEA